jgi:hypothetical protein
MEGKKLERRAKTYVLPAAAERKVCSMVKSVKVNWLTMISGA